MRFPVYRSSLDQKYLTYLAKEKQNARKEGEKVGTQGSVGKRLCKSHPFLGFV